MHIPQSCGSYRESNTGDRLRITHEIITDLSLPMYSHAVQNDSWCQVIIHISGDVEYSTPFENNKADVLDIFTTGNGENYCINWGKTEAYDRYAIYFVPQLLHGIYSHDEDRKAALSFLDRKQTSNLIKLPSNLKDELTDVLNNIEPFLGSNSSQAALGVFTATINIFNIIYKALQINKLSPKTIYSDDIVSKALNYIDDNFCEISRLSDVAQAIHISPDYLSKKFKSATGMGIKEYILDKKLYYGHCLLRLGRNVTEAYLDAGFHNMSYFIRLYKQKFGFTPGKSEKKTFD